MQARLAVVVAVSVLALGSVARADSSHDVIGGTRTPDDKYPGVGALYVPSLGGAMCTGTLIAPDVVLTAGHCLDPLFLGTEIPSFTLAHDTVAAVPEVTAGMRMMQHPLFDINLDPGTGIGTWYDVSLLFLAEPITSVDPVKMPSLDEATMLVAGTQLELVGYGRTSDLTQDIGVMYNAVAPIIIAGTSELQISMPGDPQNCNGDSGGPAIADLGDGPRIVGIVSRSANGPTCTQGGVDTRVDTYADWIYTSSGVCAVGDPRCPIPDDGGGCCSSSRRSPTGSVVLALAIGAVLARRRRR